MRIQIYNWAGERQVAKDIEALGYNSKFGHREVVNGDVFEIAKKFVDIGRNVMILQGDGEFCDFVLAVDTRSFGQR